MEELKVIFVKNRTALQRIVDYIFTFGCLFGGFFLNYRYLGNSTILKVFLVLILLMVFGAKANKNNKTMSPSEAFEYLSAYRDQGADERKEEV